MLVYGDCFAHRSSSALKGHSKTFDNAATQIFVKIPASLSPQTRGLFLLGRFSLTLNTPETDQLLERIRGGSSSAAHALVDAYRGRLRKMIAVRLDRRLQARVDPSDVVQDVLCEATQRLPQYIESSKLPFYPWLRQMAWDRLVELYIKHVRTHKRSVNRERPGAFQLSDESVDLFARQVRSKVLAPSAAAIQSELRQRVRKAMDALDDTNREIVLMHYVEQMTLREIAAMLGLSESAVKSRHIRALQKLARQIGDEELI